MEETRVFLFDAQNPSYKFEGEVELANEPFREEQMDEDNKRRMVWVFPPRRVGKHVVTEDSQEVAELFPETGEKYSEGKLKMVAHMRKERNGQLVKEAKAG